MVFDVDALIVNTKISEWVQPAFNEVTVYVPPVVYVKLLTDHVYKLQAEVVVVFEVDALIVKTKISVCVQPAALSEVTV